MPKIYSFYTFYDHIGFKVFKQEIVLKLSNIQVLEMVCTKKNTLKLLKYHNYLTFNGADTKKITFSATDVYSLLELSLSMTDLCVRAFVDVALPIMLLKAQLTILLT